VKTGFHEVLELKKAKRSGERKVRNSARWTVDSLKSMLPPRSGSIGYFIHRRIYGKRTRPRAKMRHGRPLMKEKDKTNQP